MDNVNGARPGEEDQKGPNLLQRFGCHIQSKTMSGLIELVPLLVTILVLTLIVRNAGKFIGPLVFVSGQPWNFPGIGRIEAIVVFYPVGLLISTTFDRQVMIWKGGAAKPLTRLQDGIRSLTAGDGLHELPPSLNAGGIPGIATGRDDRYGQDMVEKPAKVLTIEELSAYLRIQRPTLYQLDREGKIPSKTFFRLWVSAAILFIAV